MIPSEIVQLGGLTVVAYALVKVIERVQRNQAAREEANREVEREFRREIVRTQERIAGILENHLGEIGEHMAVQAEISRALLARKE